MKVVLLRFFHNEVLTFVQSVTLLQRQVSIKGP